MKYEIHFNPKDSIIETTVEGGIAQPSDVRDFAADVAAAMTRHGSMYALNDMCKVVPTLSMMDIFEVESIIRSAGLAGASVRALVVDANCTDTEFYETVLRNRGHLVMFFTNYDLAKQWLLRQRDASRTDPAGSMPSPLRTEPGSPPGDSHYLG